MTQSDLKTFSNSIQRIFLILNMWFKWIAKIIMGKITVTEKVKEVSPIEKYTEPLKIKFLESFREDEEHDWNSNIEDSIKDKELLSELLKDQNNELEKKWRTRILIENTPRGNVIMFYDLYKKGFSYYCDQAIMPYDIMNAAAMKYVVTFWCRDFFVDSNILPKPVVVEKKVIFEETREVDDGSKTKLQNSKIVRDKDKHAFAKFKSYNTATKKAGISKEDDKTINCFLHLGGVRNWSPVLKKVKPNPINGFQTDMVPGAGVANKKLSYLEYKKRQSTSQ
jgi:hypothetical protein